jgi:hypothetical protein
MDEALERSTAGKTSEKRTTGRTLRRNDAPGKYEHRLTRDMYALVNRKPSSRFPREMYSDGM